MHDDWWYLKGSYSLLNTKNDSSTAAAGSKNIFVKIVASGIAIARPRNF